jgi:hypothetical protein
MVTVCTNRINIKLFCFLPTQKIWVFSGVLRTNGDYFTTKKETRDSLGAEKFGSLFFLIGVVCK